MGFQALFKSVKCWRSPDIDRETVPSSSNHDRLTSHRITSTSIFYQNVRVLERCRTFLSHIFQTIHFRLLS